MADSVTILKKELAARIGVPYCAIVPAGCGEAVILRAMTARELGERAIARGDEVILVGAVCEAEKAALDALGIVAVCVPAESGAAELENALSPASKAVWLCADATVGTARTVRNFCNSLELWMLATVMPQDARACLFGGKRYHVGAVADVATGRMENVSFVCTKDELPYRLMQAALKAQA